LAGFGPALFAWLCAITCVSLGWRKLRGLASLAPPPRRELLLELIGADTKPEDLAEEARRGAIAELNQRLADVAFELEAWPAMLGSLARISLASGSALALASFLMPPDAERPLRLALRLALAAFGGLVGGAGVLLTGRSAKIITRQIRADWDVSSREIAKVLGTALAAAAEVRSIRGIRFPG
jgi:hypothetical protein